MRNLIWALRLCSPLNLVWGIAGVHDHPGSLIQAIQELIDSFLPQRRLESAYLLLNLLSRVRARGIPLSGAQHLLQLYGVVLTAKNYFASSDPHVDITLVVHFSPQHKSFSAKSYCLSEANAFMRKPVPN